MKLLPALLVAAFTFSTVVSGAPASSSSSSSAAAVLNPFFLFVNFKDFWVNIKCIHRVVDNVMDGSDVDDLWHDLKIKIKAIVDIEWKNCLKIEDSVEQEKCKIIVIEHGVHVVTKFVTQLLDDHKLDLDWQKLRNDIANKCFGEHTFEESKSAKNDDSNDENEPTLFKSDEMYNW